MLNLVNSFRLPAPDALAPPNTGCKLTIAASLVIWARFAKNGAIMIHSISKFRIGEEICVPEKYT